MSAGPILVADDNPVDRRILARFVGGEGYDVVEASDGVEALERFEETRPQAVLLDALMPRMDGFEVARQIKATSGDHFVPIIFLTALTQAEELARCLSAGGDDFLSKPYNRIILKAKLDAAQRQRTLHDAVTSQRDEIERNRRQMVRDQQTAKLTFDRIAHREYLSLPCLRYLSSPLALFDGDVLLAAPTPRGSLVVLVGDFTGHGLTASVGALPLAESFYSLTARGYGLGTIAKECNRRLSEILSPGTFCCAAFAELNLHRGHIELWLGGLPPAYVLTGLTTDAAGHVKSLPAQHMPLGILSPEQFDAKTQTLNVENGDRLVMLSDGVIESSDAAGERFGEDRLLQALRAVRSDTSSVDTVVDALSSFVGSREQVDDLTMLEVTVDSDFVVGDLQAKLDAEPGVAPERWSMRYSVEDAALANFEPMAVLAPILRGVPELRREMTNLGLVVTELFANALDHGVLGLDSAAKNDPAGFMAYFTERQQRLQSVQGRVEIDLSCARENTGVELCLSFTDSGAGFDYEAVSFSERDAGETGGENDSDTNNDTLLHGRGLRLMRQLCSTLEHSNGGRTTRVVFHASRTGGSDG